MQTLLFKDVRPKAGFKTLTEAEAKEKLGSAYEEGKAYQIDMDPRSNNYGKVFVIGGRSMYKLFFGPSIISVFTNKSKFY